MSLFKKIESCTQIISAMKASNRDFKFKTTIDLYKEFRAQKMRVSQEDLEKINTEYIYAQNYNRLLPMPTPDIHIKHVSPNKFIYKLKNLMSIMAILVLGMFMVEILQVLKLPFELFENNFNQFKPEDSNVRLSDVKGIDECRDELEDIINYIRNSQKYAESGVKLHKGFLLTGAPGTGKTLLARAVAGEAGVKFFYTSASNFDELFVGLGASRIRNLFKEAKKFSPCIIFIDEIDSIAPARKDVDPVHRQALNQLLVEIDGFTPSNNIIVIAATNIPDNLDPALKRAGRMDKQISIPLPDFKGRSEILDLYLKKIKHDKNIDKTLIIKKTIGMSGAAIENIVNLAAINAAKCNKSFADAQDFEFAIDRVLIGITRKSYSISEEEVIATAYHELGHALIGHLAGTKIHKITILPKGYSLGHTAYLQNKEHNINTKSELLGYIDTAMGGRAAEEVFMGKEKTTSGCSSDMKNATEIVYYGISSGIFSDELGSACYNNIQQLGQKQRDAIDQFAKKVLQESYDRVLQKILDRKHMIHKIALQLKEQETMTEDELIKLIKLYK